uniref:Uncharacterized protein n=1 Tax=Octopus bimaculoides TaxID=37653 RepID=A0A0L8I2C3_OCTBM
MHTYILPCTLGVDMVRETHLNLDVLYFFILENIVESLEELSLKKLAEYSRGFNWKFWLQHNDDDDDDDSAIKIRHWKLIILFY